MFADDKSVKGDMIARGSNMGPAHHFINPVLLDTYNFIEGFDKISLFSRTDRCKTSTYVTR